VPAVSQPRRGFPAAGLTRIAEIGPEPRFLV
jgi:hypothetical protein